jgi:hypothetical protein
VDLIIRNALKGLANALIGRSFFETILKLVRKWEQEGISGAEKREGVLSELKALGYVFATSAVNFGIELAVQYLKRVAK